MKRLEKERQSKHRQRLQILVSFVLLLTVILIGAQFFVSNRLTNLGSEIEQENAKSDLLISENRFLEEELRAKESLINVSEEAQKLGFAEPNSIYYLIPQIPVAMK